MCATRRPAVPADKRGRGVKLLAPHRRTACAEGGGLEKRGTSGTRLVRAGFGEPLAQTLVRLPLPQATSCKGLMTLGCALPSHVLHTSLLDNTRGRLCIEHRKVVVWTCIHLHALLKPHMAAMCNSLSFLHRVCTVCVLHNRLPQSGTNRSQMRCFLPLLLPKLLSGLTSPVVSVPQSARRALWTHGLCAGSRANVHVHRFVSQYAT